MTADGNPETVYTMTQAINTISRTRLNPMVDTNVSTISYRGVCSKGHDAWWTQTYYTNAEQRTIWVWECTVCGRGHAG